MTPSPLIVFVLVDALGWDVVGESGFLAAELPHRRPLDTVLGFSSGAIPSLLSGTWPSENGHWVMYHRDPGRSPFRATRFLAHMPSRVRRSWRLRQMVRGWAARSIHGYFNLYEVPWDALADLDVCEHENLFAPGGLGTIGTIFDDLVERRMQARVWDWRTDDDANERAFAQAVEASAQAPTKAGGVGADFLFWYTPSVDDLMHRHGTQAAPVRDRLARIGDTLTRSLGRARALGREVWCYLTSDHGMTDVTEHVDVMAKVAATGLARGIEYHAFYDSTLARFWFRTPVAEARIREALAPLPGRFLTREDEERLGFFFPDRRYGEAIFVVSEGRLIVPSYMGSQPVAAMHGYEPSVSSSRALLLSNRVLPHGLSHVVDFRGFLASEIDQGRATRSRVALGGFRP
ncbi:MAG: alkaline phosphatase family protein [Candidatus Eiseniibacteriota bacterium]